MYKFRRFLGRISAEICLKIGYFGSISPKSPSAGGSPPDSRLDLMNSDCAKFLLPLNISGWCRCLAILQQNESLYYFIFLISSLYKNRFYAIEGLIFIDAVNKKKRNIDHNIMCFIMNVIIARQNYSAHLIYLLILFKIQLSSEYVLKQEFKLKYALNYVVFIKKS